MDLDMLKKKLCGFAVLFILTVLGIICVKERFTVEFTILADPIPDAELVSLPQQNHNLSYADFGNNTEWDKTNNKELNIYESGMFDYFNSDQLKIVVDIAQDQRIRELGLFKNETCTHKLPSVFVIGVAKAGTTEIRDFLKLHPYIEAYPKESYFFSGRQYIRGLKWYAQKMPCSFKDQLVIEKTPSYFRSTNVPQRIHKMDKNAKLILMVREPISAATSLFTFFNRKHTNLTRFENCVVKQGKVDVNCQYLKNFIYAKHMKHWLQYFKLNQFFITENTEFKESPYSVVNRAQTFLGLSHMLSEQSFVLNENKGFYCLKPSFKLEQSRIACYSEKRGRMEYKTQVNATVLRILKKYFDPLNKEFFAIIGRSFNW